MIDTRKHALDAARKSVELCDKWHEGADGTGHSNFCLVSRQLLVEATENDGFKHAKANPPVTLPGYESPLSLPQECLA